MIKLLIRKLVKNYQDIDDPKVREDYGILAGTIGIIVNVLLFLAKLGVGIVINSIAVISDAFNNLTDMAASLVQIIGSKFSNKPPDKEHPLGHGRYEYIATLVVAFIIFTVGLELLQNSYQKIIDPEPVSFSVLSLLILIASILMKLWMYAYNNYIAKKINSSINRATAIDSFNDSIATTLVILPMVLGQYIDFPIDGIMGVIISFLILYSGFSVARDVVKLLLGKAPEQELVDKINEIVASGDHILGIHDLVVHDYGPGRKVASIDAEVPDDLSVVEIHSAIDVLEKRILKELGVRIVIHMDPISTDQEKIEEFEKAVKGCIDQEEKIEIENFRIAQVNGKVNVIFDIEVDKDTEEEDDVIQMRIKESIEHKLDIYRVDIKKVGRGKQKDN